jgi:hypothetical protein
MLYSIIVVILFLADRGNFCGNGTASSTSILLSEYFLYFAHTIDNCFCHISYFYIRLIPIS